MAGVDIQAGDEFVSRIKEKVRSTFSKSVLTDIGAFGAFYNASFSGFREPVLVSSVDGVGTKLKIAFLMEKHDTIGEDLVNHCVNDIAVCGARPLFFLDYFATGKLLPQVAEEVVNGMVKACVENGCSLVGGETAEMPGFYRDNEYDIAGTIVGVAEKKKIFDGRNVKAGDMLIGLPSTGLHTNGYSLARSVLLEKFEVDDFVDELGMRLGDALLAVHRSYLKTILAVSASADVHGFAHITGGGNCREHEPRNSGQLFFEDQLEKLGTSGYFSIDSEERQRWGRRYAPCLQFGYRVSDHCRKKGRHKYHENFAHGKRSSADNR